MRLWLTDETQTEVLDVIREGMRDGQGPKAIADRLREQFDWMSRVRAERIARTETLTAVATGQHKLYEQTGIEKRKWLHALHGDSREGHKMLHGTVKPLDEPFVNPITGIALAYPGDPAAGPAEVVNCRCAESPVPNGISTEMEVEILTEWDGFLTKAEESGGRDLEVALRGWFEQEGKRYVQHFLNTAGR